MAQQQINVIYDDDGDDFYVAQCKAHHARDVRDHSSCEHCILSSLFLVYEV